MKNYKDLYEFPLRLDETTGLVRDNKGQFVFQFEFDNAPLLQSNIVAIINGTIKPAKQHNFIHEHGMISENGVNYILIRGWGNLTGIGAHNLPEEEAANIQDTFAEFIVKTLNSTT